jgi:biopolymer transport protein ExbB/TolQ
MPPTAIARDLATIRAFRDRHGDVILKPLYGNGGAGVFHLPESDRNLSSLHELFTGFSREPLIVQKYLPEIKNGDKRVILVDGEPVTKIRHSLEVSMDARESRTLRAAYLFDSLGGYAPTMGIIGAVLGLIQVMTQIEDTASLGAGIATAFVATIYGVGLANLFFLPVAARLRSMAQARFGFEDMVLDGILAIADSENPRVLERRLKEYRP